jgi:sec-independent protein translocase protein TatC
LSSESLTLSEHVEELRRRLKTVVVSFAVIFVIVILFPANPIYSFEHPEQYLDLSFISNTIVASILKQVVHDILPPGWQLIAATGIGAGMEIYFMAALIVSLIIDMPIIAYETYKFVDPALTEEERRLIYPFVISTTVLFVAGVFFGYYIVAKFLVLALAPFLFAAQIAQLIDAVSFYYVVFLVIGATGISFTAPVFIYILITLGLLSPEFFTKNRVIIWFVIWVITGLFLTPDGGPLLDLVIFIPLVAMMEISVLLAKRKYVGGESKVIRCKWCNSKIERKGVFCPSCGRFNEET